jgi:DNA-binding HxlR family transcriptional regulator
MARKRTYGQFCPVAQAAEIVAERWTPLVLRELLTGSHRFNDLRRGVPLMSPSLLSQRLKELEDQGVVVRAPAAEGAGYEYHLTEAGLALRPVIEGLGLWGHKWLQRELRREELDPALLMWDIHRRADAGKLPPGERTVVQFDLDGVPLKKSRWWLVFEQGQTDLCLKNPGYEVDLHVAAHIRPLVEVWLGHLKLVDAIRSSSIRLQGERSLIRGFKDWFALSGFAHTSESAA